MSGTDGREAALSAAADALSLAVKPGDAARLLRYLDLLHRWNSTYNLTAVRDPQGMLVQHLFDCLAVIPPLSQRVTEGRRVLDVGSGGGLPGAVIAMLRPDLKVVCVDAVGKKASFVQQVAAELGLPNLTSQHARIESLKADPFDIITSRAFASLADFVSLTRRHLRDGGLWMAMKGRAPDEEIAGLAPDIDVFHVEPLTVPQLDAQRCLVWMRLRREAEVRTEVGK